MSKPNNPVEIQEQKYRPRLLCFQVMPGLEPQFYQPLLEKGLDAIIMGVVPTGGVPTEGEFSFIPFIARATELGVPVYLLRGSTNSAQKPRLEYEAYRRNMKLIYEPERAAVCAAITAGATPLERPDISLLLDVVEAIRSVYTNMPNYDEGIRQVSEIFSSPEFMEDIKRIRQQNSQ